VLRARGLLEWLGPALLVALAAGLLVASHSALGCSPSRPPWERLPCWALSAFLAIVASGLILVATLLIACIVVERWDR
jgi:hypothetical protein